MNPFLINIIDNVKLIFPLIFKQRGIKLLNNIINQHTMYN